MFVPYDLGLGVGHFTPTYILMQIGFRSFFYIQSLIFYLGVTVVLMEGNYAMLVWVTLVPYCG